MQIIKKMQIIILVPYETSVVGDISDKIIVLYGDVTERVKTDLKFGQKSETRSFTENDSFIPMNKTNTTLSSKKGCVLFTSKSKL